MSTERAIAVPMQRMESHSPKSLLPSANEFDMMVNMAKQFAATDFAPKDMRNKPAEMLAAMMHGREVGLPPMASLAHINVIQGRPSISAQGMRALVQAAGHSVYTTQFTDEAVTVVVKRKDDPDHPTERTWTMADAKRAGLTGQYGKYPRQMLFARASADACKAACAAELMGFALTSEEAEEIDVEPLKPITLVNESPSEPVRQVALPAAEEKPKGKDLPPIPLDRLKVKVVEMMLGKGKWPKEAVDAEMMKIETMDEEGQRMVLQAIGIDIKNGKVFDTWEEVTEQGFVDPFAEKVPESRVG